MMVREILIGKLKVDHNLQRLNKKNASVDDYSREKTAKSSGVRREQYSCAQERA